MKKKKRLLLLLLPITLVFTGCGKEEKLQVIEKAETFALVDNYDNDKNKDLNNEKQSKEEQIKNVLKEETGVAMDKSGSYKEVGIESENPFVEDGVIQGDGVPETPINQEETEKTGNDKKYEKEKEERTKLSYKEAIKQREENKPKAKSEEERLEQLIDNRENEKNDEDNKKEVE